MSRGPDIRHHEDEALPGLPEPLPPGETILWQGRPEPVRMALTTFPVLWVAAWFVALAAWRGFSLSGAADMVAAVSWTLAVGALAVGFLAFIGWAASWTSLYTITNRRVVMRIGIAVDKCVNLPFSQIVGAQMRLDKPARAGVAGAAPGDLTLQLKPGTRIGWLVFWPHVRLWPVALPVPRLTALADAGAVAVILRDALLADAARRGVEAVGGEAAGVGASAPQGRASGRLLPPAGAQDTGGGAAAAPA